MYLYAKNALRTESKIVLSRKALEAIKLFSKEMGVLDLSEKVDS